MNTHEANQILRKTLAYCPSQSVDQYTPDAWAESLADIEQRDALEAVRNLGSMPLEPGRSRYIEPGHVIAEVRRIRSARLAAVEDPTPPAELDPAEAIAWQREQRRRIASGDTPPQLPARQTATKQHLARLRRILADAGGKPHIRCPHCRQETTDELEGGYGGTAGVCRDCTRAGIKPKPSPYDQNRSKRR